MNNWLALDADHWRSHPLNHLRGGMIWVLVWIGFQSLLAALILWIVATDASQLFDPAIPVPFNWVQWLFLAAGPPVVFALIIRRVSQGATLYFAYFCGALLFPFWAEQWSPFLTSPDTYRNADGLGRAVLFIAFTVIDLVALAYLFRSDRANVVLRRRIRVT
ncbi:MAG: hypothetical protein AAF501_12875 [Pseudomonadota bacterium]